MHTLRSSLITPSPSLDVAYDLLAFEQWRNHATSEQPTENYLFLEPRVRFSPEPDDVLMLTAASTLEHHAGNLCLSHIPSGARVVLGQLDAAVAERIVKSIDGQRSLISVQLTALATESEMDTFLRATFGRFTLCPKTLAAFEQRIASSSLVRFPGSPYEVGRYYWSNMADVRESWIRERADFTDPEDFMAALKRYHVRALIGASGRSFYRPSSPIMAKAGARAGSFYDVPTRTIREAELTLFIDGPRVSAPFVGGHKYHELLCHSLGDAEALAPERAVSDDSGLNWGRLTLGRARSDGESGAWFIPPRPLTMAHFAQIFRDYMAAIGQLEHAPDAAISALAAFHWDFVRLHPFACANQSIAMNLVGGLLELMGRFGMPHLVLDHLALRLSREAYARLFHRALLAWSSPEGATFVERQQLLIRKRNEMEGLITKIGQVKGHFDATQWATEAPEAARLALLTD